jgi:Mo-dependent nitrogenase C-terminus
MDTSSTPFENSDFNLLQPVKQWLDQFEIHDRKIAYCIVKLIPAQCPFERDITCFGQTIAHIPPLCKLNPLYEQLAELRFRALCYLADKQRASSYF